MQNKTVRKLVESALFIAIATVLSMLKIDLPFGGGVTIVSMLPLVLVSHRWGWKWGVMTAFAYSLIQLLLGLDNVGYATTFATALGVIFLDYVIAYTVIGFSGALEKPFGKTARPPRTHRRLSEQVDIFLLGLLHRTAMINQRVFGVNSLNNEKTEEGRMRLGKEY